MAAYLPGTMNDFPSGKTHLTLWELDKKNKAKLILHNNFKRKAFVACSRFTTCWNFDTFIPNAIVEYDDDSRKEGIVATIKCGHPFKLSENGKVLFTRILKLMLVTFSRKNYRDHFQRRNLCSRKRG